MVRGALIAAAVLLFPAVASAEQSRIAFGSGSDVAVINADGTGRAAVVHPADGYAADPSWSRDGTRLALTVSPRDEAQARINTVRADGSGLAQLTPRGRRTELEFSPQWSPDGLRVAFVRWRFGDRALVTSVVTIGADGTGQETLARIRSRPFTGIGDVTWSPDGTRLLYSRTVRDKHNVYRPSLWSIAATGGDRRLVARDAMGASFSPDGTRIAYEGVDPRRRGESCGEDGCTLPGDIYVSNADGSGARRLTGTGSDDRAPAWSPDGAHIVFSSDRNYPRGDNSYELYSITPDGGCLTWLTNGTPGSDYPDWEPGAGRTSDPGGCGARPRTPFIGVDLAGARAFSSSTPYWVGPIAPDGTLLSNVDAGIEGVRLDYADCGEYDAARCPRRTFHMYSTPVCGGSYLPEDLDPAELVLYNGALVSRDPSYAEIWSGTMYIAIDGPGRARLEALLAQLRPVTSDTPSPLEPGALPSSVWRRLGREARSKHGRSARRVRSIRRKLIRLGVGRLAC